MFEVSQGTQIGLGLAAMGLAFIVLGVVLLFDKGLLAIGNLMFLTGLSFIIGTTRTFSFLIQYQNIKGTLLFFAGIIIILAGHPIIGVIIEFVGLYYLSKRNMPSPSQCLTLLGYAKERSIV